jgi:hypothetical protein
LINVNYFRRGAYCLSPECYWLAEEKSCVELPVCVRRSMSLLASRRTAAQFALGVVAAGAPLIGIQDDGLALVVFAATPALVGGVSCAPSGCRPKHCPRLVEAVGPPVDDTSCGAPQVVPARGALRRRQASAVALLM